MAFSSKVAPVSSQGASVFKPGMDRTSNEFSSAI
jgi:hypothetical protein